MLYFVSQKFGKVKKSSVCGSLCIRKISQIGDVNVAVMLLNYRSNTVHSVEPSWTSVAQSGAFCFVLFCQNY